MGVVSRRICICPFATLHTNWMKTRFQGWSTRQCRSFDSAEERFGPDEHAGRGLRFPAHSPKNGERTGHGAVLALQAMFISGRKPTPRLELLRMTAQLET